MYDISHFASYCLKYRLLRSIFWEMDTEFLFTKFSFSLVFSEPHHIELHVLACI